MSQIMTAAGIVTGTAAAAAVVWSMLRWARRITAGARCQLRGEMLQIYYHNRAKGTIRQYEYENFVMAYEAYRALGGNSFMEKIYDEVRTWEVVT